MRVRACLLSFVCVCFVCMRVQTRLCIWVSVGVAVCVCLEWCGWVRRWVGGCRLRAYRA